MTNPTQTAPPDNWVYYAQTGNGVWTGKFSFTITNWKLFWQTNLGFWNKFFAVANHLNHSIFGTSKILSTLKVHPSVGPSGIVTNVVHIKRFGITLYKLEERYVLHQDGTQVYVHSHERYGPFPPLFKRSKKHPARILAEGKGAVYLNMPILGAIWTGDYKVSDTQDEINARLYCEWAEGHENISKQTNGPNVTHEVFSYPERINEVIVILERYRYWFEFMKDPRATFTHSYLEMTREFARQIPLKDFVDRDWIHELDVLFANEYLHALHDYEQGIDNKSGWNTVFATIIDGKTSVLEELVTSMAAHIIQDLPITLIKSAWRTKPEKERIHDFHLANDILGNTINRIQKEVSRRYNPILKLLDQFGKGDDEILTNYGIRVSRGLAWYNAIRYTANPEEVTKSLQDSVGIVVKQIVHPPFSLDFLLRIFRFISKLTRRWPSAKVQQLVVEQVTTVELAPAN